MRKLCCSGGIQESASHPTTGLQVLQIIVFMTVVLVLSIYCNRNVIGGKPLALVPIYGKYTLLEVFIVI